MPTGYTDCIKDGISFKDFVLRCARAMGALVMMRDDSLDKPIPDKFEPYDYHVREIKKVEDELNKIENMSDKQIEKLYKFERYKALTRAKKNIRESNELEKKYQEMLKKVKKWNPPVNHMEFKNFMITQLNDSIRFDCSADYWYEEINKPVLSTEEWKKQRIKQLKSDLKYHIIENEKEIERTNERNLWVEQLRESLEEFE